VIIETEALALIPFARNEALNWMCSIPWMDTSGKVWHNAHEFQTRREDVGETVGIRR
jgi:hypothetical protein